MTAHASGKPAFSSTAARRLQMAATVLGLVTGITAADADTVASNLPGDGIAVSAMAGRTTTLQLGDSSITGVEVLNGPAHGNITVNPDNSLAIVLTTSGQTSDISCDIRITHADGTTEDRTVEIDVTPGVEQAGWGNADFYKLATDSDNRTIVEHGENHREVYVSASAEALTLADIAAREGVDVSQVTGQFLVEHSQYGSSEDLALAQDAGKLLWTALMDASRTEPSSHWLMFERGYTYDKMENALPSPGANGESELHPIYLGAFGDGTRPEITTMQYTFKEGSENVVIQDLHFSGSVILNQGSNFIFDSVEITRGDLVAQGINERFQGFTFRNSAIYDVYRDEPTGGRTTWEAIPDRVAGLYASLIDNLLIEDSFFDHAGWSDDYLDGNGQPPGLGSHNIYLQSNATGVTLRDNIIMRGGGNDAQIRSGGFIEDNIFMDSNAGVFFAAGGADNDGEGNYTLFTGNVVTSGGHRQVDGHSAGLTMGITNKGFMPTLLDNIVAHLANPNDPDELASKPITHLGLDNNTGAPVYDNTIVYNWAGANAVRDAQDQNVDGLDRAVLDETTIQNFASQLLGKANASIADLANYLRAAAHGELDSHVDADLINAYFQTAFGLSTTLRAEAATLRFIPNELGDGVRWDNRMNWDSGDLPGTQDGDSVDLGGNWVFYEGTSEIRTLEFGLKGELNVTNGLLRVTDGLVVDASGATLNIDRSGQFWTGGYSDTDVLRVNAAGGRYANTGLSIGNIKMDVSDNAQVLLATDGAEYIMRGRSQLTVTGGDAKVGFDGQAGGTAALLMTASSDLTFVAEGGKIGTIGEFYSGHYDAGAGGVRSGVNLGGATLEVDVSDVAALGIGKFDLIHVDELIGTFGTINIVGLAKNQSAKVVINYTTDKVTLLLGEVGKGDGLATLQLVGKADSAMSDRELFDILTDGHGVYPVDRPEAPTHETLDGTSTDDVIKGTEKDSYMRGFTGNDTLDGRNGHDTLFGARGDDVIYGRRGIDTLVGGAGHDTLYGGGRSDTLTGGAGKDFLSGGRGNDRLTGGSGRDTFHFDESFSRDRITDFEIGRDKLHLDFAGADFDSLNIHRGSGGTVIETIQGVIVLEGILPQDLSASDFMF